VCLETRWLGQTVVSTSRNHPVYAPNLYNGVATISRLLKITGLFCRLQYLFKGSFAKEPYHFKEPTNRSFPIPYSLYLCSNMCILFFYAICIYACMCMPMHTHIYTYLHIYLSVCSRVCEKAYLLVGLSTCVGVCV